MNLNPKTYTAGIAGALATVIMLLAEQFGLHLHAEEAAAIVTVVMFAAAYFKSQGDWTPKS